MRARNAPRTITNRRKGNVFLLPDRNALASVANEDVLRARFYGLLALVLSAPPDAETLSVLRRLEADDTLIGRCLGALAEAAELASPNDAEDEFNALFVGLTEGELKPYGSYYLTGFLYEKPLADLRWDMERLGIARGDDVSEPEDHIASLCEVMQGLIVGNFGEPADLATQNRFFDIHLAPWASRFFEDLETADSAVLYRPVGSLGRAFMAIEREAFAMVA
ncbi:MAG: molecular chaperone TorD family protein [Rhodospirillales bacterium]|nr:molecular chaperone TorD family protein [Rhodospirillales bacterium]